MPLPDPLKLLLEDSRASDETHRTMALSRASRLPAQQGAPILLEALGDGNPGVRATAASGLRECRLDSVVLPLLAAATNDGSSQVRTSALVSLEVYEFETIKELLMELVMSTTAPTSHSEVAARGLWKYSDPTVLTTLAFVVSNHAKVQVRREAAASLAFLSAQCGCSRVVAEAWERANNDKDAVVSKIAQQVLSATEGIHPVARGQVSIEEAEESRRLLLERSVNLITAEARETAIYRLEELGGQRSFVQFEKACKDVASDVRHAAVVSLGNLRMDEAVPLLIASAESDEDEEVRQFAVLGLAEYCMPEIANFLVRLLEDWSTPNRVCEVAANQMWKYNAPQVIDALEPRILEDSDPNVRLFASLSMGFLFRLNERPSSISRVLEVAATDESPAVAMLSERLLSGGRE